MTFRGDKGRDVKLLDGEKQGKRPIDYSADGYEAIMVGIVANNPLRDAGWHDIFSVPCRSENDFDVSSSRNTSGEMESLRRVTLARRDLELQPRSHSLVNRLTIDGGYSPDNLDDQSFFYGCDLSLHTRGAPDIFVFFAKHTKAAG